MSQQKKQQPQGKQSPPKPTDILTIQLRIPRQYYDMLSQFANYLSKTPMLHPQTGQPMKNPQNGQVVMSMPAPDIQTYLLTCGIRTYEAFQTVMALQQQQQQAQAQQAQQK